MIVLSLFIGHLGFSAWAQDVVLFYRGENFAGPTYSLAQDRALWRETGFLQVNSIRVPPRCTVIFFREPGFSGEALILRRDLKKLRAFLPWAIGKGSVQVHWDTDDLGKNRGSTASSETAPLTKRAAGVASTPTLPVKRPPVLPDLPPAADTTDTLAYGEMSGRQIGVILYDGLNFGGAGRIFYNDDKNLTKHVVGPQGIKSIRIPEGYKVILYEKKRFGGRFETLSANDGDLRDNGAVSNRVSSLRVSWADPTIPEQKRPKVVLFREKEYRGISSSFYSDDPDFEDDEIGDNRAVSIRIPKGCQVTLYDGKNFHGRAIVLQASKADLDFTEIGKYRISSLRIRWESQRNR